MYLKEFTNLIKDLFSSEESIDIKQLSTEEIWKAHIDKVKEEPELWKHNSTDLKWHDWENRKIVGWRSSKPVKGDIYEAEMQSGHIAWFVFLEIDKCGDPHDMFFAEVADLGYKRHIEDHITLAEPKMRLL